MRAETSFSQKLKVGWTKERLKAYYGLSEVQYEKILACVERIRQGVKE